MKLTPETLDRLVGYNTDEGESIDAHVAAWRKEREMLLEALCVLGYVGGEGYCFCSNNQDPDKDRHQPECRDARAAISKATGGAQ